MRGRDRITDEQSLNSALEGRRCPHPSLGQKKPQNSKCAQFENAYTAQQARKGIRKNEFNSNSNYKLIRITVWFQFVNNENSSKIISH